MPPEIERINLLVKTVAIPSVHTFCKRLRLKRAKKNGGFKSLVTSISLPVFQVPAQERTWEGSKLKAGWRSFACSDSQALNNREVFGIIIIDSFQEIISCSFSIIIYNI